MEVKKQRNIKIYDNDWVKIKMYAEANNMSMSEYLCKCSLLGLKFEVKAIQMKPKKEKNNEVLQVPLF